MDLRQVRRRIHDILSDPSYGYTQTHPRARAGLRWIVEGTHRTMDHEHDCDSYTDWLHEHGESHGLRPPTAEERARAAGLEHYYAALGLTGRRLYDTVGLSFDGRALQRRLWPLVRAWSNDTATRAPPCPDVPTLLQIFRSLDGVIQQHAPLAPRASAPFPPDLLARWLPVASPGASPPTQSGRGRRPGAQVSAGQPAAGVINDQIRNAKPWPWR